MTYFPKNHCQKQKGDLKISVHVNNKTWKTHRMELELQTCRIFYL